MKKEALHEVEFQPIGKRVAVPEGATVLDAARQAGIDLTSACGGEGNCGQCQVVWIEGKISPPTSDDEFYIAESDRKQGYRLACQAQVLGDLKLHLPKDSLITGQRLQVESNLRSIQPDPILKTYPVEMVPATLEDVRSDLTRLTEAMQTSHRLSGLTTGTPFIRSLSPALRLNDWKVQAVVREREIVAVLPPEQRLLGLAVDLGTTKIAAILTDLKTGREIASAGLANPQISYGEDVIRRLNYAVREAGGAQRMAESVRGAINELLGELLQRALAERGQVMEACIVGNTAMTHLLLGFPVRQLASAPYVSAASAALDVPAGELDLDIAPGGRVHIPPNVGGYVGGDHVAMVLASDLDTSDKITLGLDIGTNTEISLRIPGRDELTAVSCASGPAFEGAHIRDGMRAASGAIEKVRITPQGMELTTIDDEPAVGLCGSGILDSIAELYRTGYLNQHGRYQRSVDGVREGDHGPEVVLVPARKSGSGRDIVITQHDVNEIQLAKGAIHAGLNILLEETGTPPEAVQEVIVAGAFGSFLNIQNAIQIGLFPQLLNAQYRQVGNAAALGARWILISRQARQRAAEIARRTRYLELTTYPKFSRQFALAMLFPRKENT